VNVLERLSLYKTHDPIFNVSRSNPIELISCCSCRNFQIAVGGEVLHVWRVTEKVLRKTSRAAEGDGQPASELGGRPATSHRAESIVLRNVAQELGVDSCEHDNLPSVSMKVGGLSFLA
jgi:hypothetical protein